MIYLTRKEHFNAAHKLYNPSWSKEKNFQVYGDCSNENWHGHNYELFVTIKGKVNNDDGMVINLKLLSKIINDEIISKVDHKNLNLDVPFLKNKITSTENVVIEFWNILDKKISSLEDCNCFLHCIKLYETPKNSVEYYGPER
tara:strand:- start:202 stop:630 length:429 start_codon:yes stop_codon:yes gene_type:complete